MHPFYLHDVRDSKGAETSMTDGSVQIHPAHSPMPPSRSSQAAADYAGSPPLIAGESAGGYEALLARVTNALNPADALEEVWIRDIVDLVWEVFRLRRLRAGLMAAAAHEGLAELLGPLLRDCNVKALADGWAAREPKAVAQVEAALAGAGFTLDHVAARTFSLKLFDFERIDRMLTVAEQRRAAALRELDRHREEFSQRLRRSLAPIEEDEFDDDEEARPA
jgi:hypothetical protein